MPPQNHSRSSQLREGKVADRTRTREENCVALSLAIRDGERAGEQGVKSEKNLTAETIASHRNRRVTDYSSYAVISRPAAFSFSSLSLFLLPVVSSACFSTSSSLHRPFPRTKCPDRTDAGRDVNDVAENDYFSQRWRRAVPAYGTVS